MSPDPPDLRASDGSRPKDEDRPPLLGFPFGVFDGFIAIKEVVSPPDRLDRGPARDEDELLTGGEALYSRLLHFMSICEPGVLEEFIVEI